MNNTGFACTDTESNLTNVTPDQLIIVNSSFLINTTPTSNTTPTCSLSLHSNPEGALIFIDGSYLGKTTPYILEENPGDRHTVRFEFDGFVPAERNLIVMNDTIVCESLYSDVISTKGYPLPLWNAIVFVMVVGLITAV